MTSGTRGSNGRFYDVVHGISLWNGVRVQDVYFDVTTQVNGRTSGLLVAEATADAAGGRTICWTARRDAALALLEGLAGADDLVVVMGAGDIDELGRALAAGGGGR